MNRRRVGACGGWLAAWVWRIRPRGSSTTALSQSLGTASLEEEVCAEIRDKHIKLVVIDSLSVLEPLALDVSEHKDVVRAA